MKNQCFLKMFAGFLFLLLLSGCGGQPAESDNSADVLARIQAGATPLTPPPTKEVILEATEAPVLLEATEASPTPFVEHPAITAEKRVELLKKAEDFVAQNALTGEHFIIMQQEDTVIDDRYYLQYEVTAQKDAYPTSVCRQQYYIDMETEQLYLGIEKKLYAQDVVGACMKKMKETLSREKAQQQLCVLDGEKERDDGRYYVMHVFSSGAVMEDGTSFAYTYGWYYINMDTMEVYKWDVATDTLNKC